MQQYLLVAVISFVVALVGVKAALVLFPKWGLMDKPKKYGHDRDPIPYPGGIMLYVVFMVLSLTFLPWSTQVMGVLVGASLIVGVSFLDDLYDLNPWVRLGVQILAALVVVVSGIGITSITNPLGEALVLDQQVFELRLGEWTYPLVLWSAFFTLIWIVSIVNTMNFLDGLNGLPSGVTVIAAATLFFLSTRPGLHHSDQALIANLSLIVMGMTLAFWLFDFYPAKILMGDTGSMLLGFLIAVMAIFSGGKVATVFLVLGVPILDVCWIIIRRTVFERRSPMKGDLKHFHHRLLDAGLSDRKALLLIYFLCAIFGGLAVLLESRQKLYAIIVMTLLMVILGSTVVYYQHKHGSGSGSGN